MSKKNVESENRVLIQIVKCNDWIFRKDKRFIHNEDMKAQLWQQMSAAIAGKGFPLLDPKTRWQKLRDQFTRHDRNRNYKWLYYEDMKFMLDHIYHRDNAPARTEQEPASSTAEDANQSSCSTMHFNMHRSGNEAPNVEPEELPVWTIPSSMYPVENPVQPLEPITDYTPASTSTMESSWEDPNWEHSYAISEISTSVTSLTVDSIPSPNCTTEKNSTCPTEELMESPVPLATGSCVLAVKQSRIPPTNSSTNLIANSTSIRASYAKKSPTIPLSGFASTSKRLSPLIGTPMGNMCSTNITNRVAEPPCVSTHLGTPKTTKVGQKRSSVVPPLDVFAKKKNREAGQLNATDEAIIGCSNDLRAMSSDFKDLLRLKKSLLEAQLQAGRIEVGIPNKGSMLESGDGFFQLLQEEWVQLPVEIQDELFPDMLDIMEQFEAQ